MKPLKRPMFRNGGPIKEGIMQGMKEPQAINTVGSPLAPKDSSGRQGYAIPLLYGAGMAAARFLPAAYRGFKAARAYQPMSQNLGALGRLKDIFMPKPGLGAPMAPSGAGAGFRVGSLLRSNPLSIGLPAASLGAEAAVGLAKMGPGALKSYANMVIPFADPFDTSGAPKESEKKTKLERTDKITNVGEIDTKTTKPGTTPQISEAEKSKLQTDRINSTKEKYYKLMGVDRLNKDATYDSLIDASKAIQEEGADLKGSIKSGTLQNKIISAISKNLDKSTDLKKQIDAAVLKGEIQKDINLTKPSAFQEQLAFIKNNPNNPLAKKLSGSTSVADIIAASVASGKGATLTSDNVASIIESKGTDTSGVIPDDKYQKWAKSNEGKDEIDFFIEKYSGLDDGLYIVNKKAFRKQGNQIAPISLDSIIG